MWGPRISSEAITISYWCTSREWVAGISRASCARISIANKILVLRRRTCCQAKQRISFYFGFPWEVACLADALNLLYIDECEGGLQRRLVGVKLFPMCPPNLRMISLFPSETQVKKPKQKGRGALSEEVFFCGHQTYAFLSVHTRALQKKLLKHFETTVAFST